MSVTGCLETEKRWIFLGLRRSLTAVGADWAEIPQVLLWPKYSFPLLLVATRQNIHCTKHTRRSLVITRCNSSALKREMVWTLHRDWPHRPLMSSSRLTGEGIILFLVVNFTCLQSSPARSFSLRSGRRPLRSAAGPGCRPGRWRWRHPAACWPAGSDPPCHGFPWCL